MPRDRRVRVVVGQLEVLGAEVVDVGRPAGPPRSAAASAARRGSRASISLDRRQLVGVDVRVLDPVHVLHEARSRSAARASARAPCTGPCSTARRSACRPERWLWIRCSLSSKTSAWIQPWQGAIVLRELARPPRGGWRSGSRGSSRGAVQRQVAELLDQVRELVEAGVLAVEVGREVAERVPVGAGPEVARARAPATRTSPASPRRPTSRSRTRPARRASARR